MIIFITLLTASFEVNQALVFLHNTKPHHSSVIEFLEFIKSALKKFSKSAAH